MKKKIKKQVLKIGEWKHNDLPGGVLRITKEYIKKLKNNFERNPFVPIFRIHTDNSVAERNPSLIISKNIEGLEVDEDGLNAIFEVSKDEKLQLNDVSVRIDHDYTDHETGDFLGDVLAHIAMIPSRVMVNLRPFQELSDSRNVYFINLSEISLPLDLNPILLSELRKFPEHFNKSNSVWLDWINKNQAILQKYS